MWRTEREDDRHSDGLHPLSSGNQQKNVYQILKRQQQQLRKLEEILVNVTSHNAETWRTKTLLFGVHVALNKIRGMKPELSEEHLNTALQLETLLPSCAALQEVGRSSRQPAAPERWEEPNGYSST